MELVKLQEAIERAGANWQGGETTLSQLSDQEKQMRLGFQPRPDEPSLQELEQIGRINYEAFITFKAQGQTVGYPNVYDLRTGGFVTSIKDQKNCGSCVAFGTVATIEATFRRQRNNPNLNIDLSEAHLFYCYAKNEGMNCKTGWWPDHAMEAAKKGIVDEACFPYTPGDQDCKLCSDSQNRLVTISNYHKITDISAMKEWLSSRGALSGCFSVYDDFFSYKSGVYRHVTGDLKGGHCISIIGYNDNQGC
ncbi:dipeptidyl-peptidase 1 [Richelia sinica FACHB-800]|uniref:Dipeptidyl-peptidase 1 n=1 Tax=Richelia sinica FACHB-800 TaxID=1357546 RepID=A0A975T4N0_9NOST|nr:peptidase C1 [Richelia sinica FACHB-800]QXE21413.1 dipeptidyl-peptidase 1 [Richelia sinica FACHB-800]